MRNKIVSLADAVAIVRNRDTLTCSGFGGSGVPDALLAALRQRFDESGEPKELTLFFGGGPGDAGEKGLNRLAVKGLLKRVIGGHYGLVPKIGAMAIAGDVEAYNLPLGCISHLYRDIAAGKPGTLTHVGLGTFVDPRMEGGKVNDRTKDDLVSVQTIAGKEYLFYDAMPLSVAFLRGTTADPEGNITMEHETLTQDALAIATAVKNSGGFVIVQVERIADTGTLNSREVVIPGILVDCVAVAKTEEHMQTFATPYDAGFAGRIKVPLTSLQPMPLDERKVIARRAAMELVPNAVINLGIGMPEGVASVANEEKIIKHLTMTAEPGVIGGVPANGLNFGAAVNASAIIAMNQQFDLYDGGGLDMACLGLAQCDRNGNINVSKFGPKLAGAGGFINITQNAKTVVFAGTFTAGGLRVSVDANGLHIEQEGKFKKFIDKVEQVTFAGSVAVGNGQPVLYVTERCVFRLTGDGLELTEIAPGIDIDKHILPLMDFEPVIRDPRPMDSRIFRSEPMGLKDQLLNVSVADRITYDALTNTLFLNFEGLRVRNRQDVDEIREAVMEKCKPAAMKVHAIVNYDAFQIDDEVWDDYADMAAEMTSKYYETIRRYTTSAFMRMKLGESFRHRGLAAHIFETPVERI